MRWIMGAVAAVAVLMTGGGVAVAAAPAAQPALGQPVAGAGEPELRVYDLRDLIASLPAPRARGAEEGGRRARRAVSSPFSEPPAEAGDRADELLRTLAGAAGAEGRELLEGVYAVVGTPEAHAALESMLRAMRELHAQTYLVQVRAVSVAAGEAPAVGAAAGEGGLEGLVSMGRGSASVVRRVATTIASERRHTYIADWSPVVSDNAVAYDPASAEAAEGMRMAVTVGAGAGVGEAGQRGEGGEGGMGGEVVQVRGVISRVEFDSVTAPAIGMDGGTLSIGLPRVEERVVESTLRVPLGTPTVVAVVDGFDQGESVIVLVATVDRGARR